LRLSHASRPITRSGSQVAIPGKKHSSNTVNIIGAANNPAPGIACRVRLDFIEPMFECSATDDAALRLKNARAMNKISGLG